MPGKLSTLRQRRREVELEQNAHLDEAEAALDGAAREASRKQEEAALALSTARRAEANAAMADQRLASALGALDYAHGVQGRAEPAIATQFAAAVYAPLLWAADCHEELRGEDERRTFAAEETARYLPGVPAAVVDELRRRPRSKLPRTNYEHGKSCGLTLGHWDAYRQAPARILDGKKQPVQLAPAFNDDGTPLTETEFRDILKARKAAAAMARRRVGGALPLDEHRAVQDHNRAVWAKYAKRLGVKVDTAQRQVRSGKVPAPDGLVGAIRTRVPSKKEEHNSGNACSDEDGGLMAPPRHTPRAKPKRTAASGPVGTVAARVRHFGTVLADVKNIIEELQPRTRRRG
ncbi:hypothetical protein ASC89_22115 [Devosia sp. Root413D1]|uniref:hypothetical protein n=1 Tax=Devosia sp. Root413D1 TaxID=1736531 RepID=UPI0006F81E9F|nr:hypothetical protein [Devosia sp. Root413D1]KQW75635.1 hypothetical protein ASC89_22115 [Devosia sp. Root413D1]